MDVQLQELIAKIKKDGVASAEASAKVLIAEAEKKAAAIIEDANKKSDEIIKGAKAEAERFERAGTSAIEQAGRNLLISFRDSLVGQLNAFVQSETAAAYNKDTLKKLVPETVKAWAKNSDASGLSVLLSEKDAVALQGEFSAALKDEIAKGLEIKPDKTLSAGFKIGVNNGAAYYDYSAEAVADLFAAYLNPKIAEILKNAAKS